MMALVIGRKFWRWFNGKDTDSGQVVMVELCCDGTAAGELFG